MNSKNSLLARVSIRWRLAVASASMTLLILLAFAFFVGQLTSTRLYQDFDDRLNVAAANLQDKLRVHSDITGNVSISGPDLDDYSAADKAAIRVVRPDGSILSTTNDAPNLGLPVTQVRHYNGYTVVARPIAATLGQPPAWVQYARKTSEIDSTVSLMWLLLGLGVFGGTLLALAAGWAVARRAMSPIADLTKAAQEIELTHDTSKRIPLGNVDDEVTDLARTLDRMISSLDRAKSEREQAYDAQREFVADASHELRTPLTSIMANLELLQSELERGEDENERVGAALRSSKRMRNLISDMLLLARSDTGRSSVKSETDFSQVVSDVVSELKPLTAGKQFNVEIESGIMVDGNQDELHRLAQNLIDNSIKHTPEGTRLDVSLSQEDGVARLTVVDNGNGIPDELIPRIFDRFVSSSNDSSAGTGLGLAIVKAVANSHQGTVSVESIGGSKFTVEVPVKSAG